jgi:hypothetical protein
MSSPRVPARVHILLARRAATAIVIRRGPSKVVCTMSWDRRKDTFAMGQWLKGRIYERRCDLSPDGRHFIYFAMNGKWTKSDAKGSWSAISKAPYLKALGLWANGSCWNGGGMFLGDREYWLNAFPFGHVEVRAPRGLTRHEAFPFTQSFGGECPGVYYHRLQRDGWSLIRHERRGEGGVSVFEKSLDHGWVLEKQAHATIHHAVGRGVYFDTHRLYNPRRRATHVLPDAEWADWEAKQTRLVWVRDGVLYEAKLTADGLSAERALYDFNPLRFESIQAPY